MLPLEEAAVLVEPKPRRSEDSPMVGKVVGGRAKEEGDCDCGGSTSSQGFLRICVPSEGRAREGGRKGGGGAPSSRGLRPATANITFSNDGSHLLSQKNQNQNQHPLLSLRL